MKTKSTLFASICVIALTIGCAKEETTSPPLPTNAPAAPNAATDAVAPAGRVADAVASAAEDQAQGLIGKAKELAAESRYTEALASLKQLNELKLTPEQQTLVDELKAQVQKAATKEASGQVAQKLGDLAPR